MRTASGCVRLCHEVEWKTMRDRNFAFALIERALLQPERMAFEGIGGQVSYQRFADLVMNFARRMQDFGVGPGSRIGLALESPVLMGIAVTAVTLLGARWRKSGSAALDIDGVSDTHQFAGGGYAGSGSYEFTKAWFEAPSASRADLDIFTGHAHPSDIWHIATSSGTTGRPKRIPIGYDAAWQRIAVPSDAAQRLISYSLFDGTSYVGIRSLLTNLLAGGTNLTNLNWAQVLERNADRVVGSPAHIGRLLQRQAPPLKRLATCRLTGAQVTHKFVEKALGYFEEVQVLYGSTEAGIMTLASFSNQRPFDGSVGSAVAGASVEIVDANGSPVADNVEGQVRARTPGVADHYLNEPELTAAVFRDGWFYPGDLGYLDVSGVLHLTGRANDVINIAGTKVNAAEIDEAIQLHPQVEDGFCFVERSADGYEKLAAVVSLRGDGAREDLVGLRSFAEERMASARFLHRLYVVTTVPRNENGKPKRTSAAELVRDLAAIQLA